MKNKKWIMALLLSALMIVCLFSLVACDEGAGGGSEGGGDTPNVSSTPSEGLEITTNYDRSQSVVIGIGTCTDTDVVIPSSYNGLPVTGIVGSAFEGCTSLTSVTIPDSVTLISYLAFTDCTSLTSITVDDNNPEYKSIDGNLYNKDGSELILYAIGKPDTSFTIPDSVTSIGNYAFSDCTSLTSVTIPNSVTSIEWNAFSGCDSLTYNTYENAKYLGNTSNPYHALITSENDSITSCTIHPDTKVIAGNAFEDCTSLNAVYISDIAVWCGISFGDISDNPLYYANNLYLNGTLVTHLVIPNGVTSIGDLAFSECTSLTSVTIPDSVTSIGDYAFYDCTSLTSVTIPDSVTSIGDYAFYDCTSLTSVTIPDSVTSIGDGAFYDCTSLTSVMIPDNVTSIGDSAFDNCTSLTNIVVENNNPNYKSVDGNLYSNDGTILLQYAIGKEDPLFEIPSGVTSLSVGVFRGCASLTSVKITSSVTSIGDHAFHGCRSLTNITIPNSVTSIGDGVFMYCSNLTSVTIPNSITIIGESASERCSSLESVIIPDSVASIGEEAFLDCYALTYNTYEETKYLGNESNPYYALISSVNDKITSCSIHPDTKVIANSAFRDCSNLTSVTIPDSVTSIGTWAFRDCSNLTSVTIGNGDTSIGDGAFEYCSNLTSVTIGNGETSVGPSAFWDCESLTSVTFEEGSQCKSIGRYAFNACTNLTSVTIPDSVTSIGDSAFNDCTSLASIDIPDSVTSIGESVFQGCTSLTNITVGSNNTEYKSIDGNLYSKDGTVLKQYAVAKTDTLFVIPESITSIGDSAFYGCKSLTSVTIPDSVTSIGDLAFYGCTSLTNVTFGGTKVEWSVTITHGRSWKREAPFTVVHCSDGDVAVY